MRSSSKYKNEFKQDEFEPRMTSIYTTPKFAIGQRCFLLETAAGNVLWDCITYLDEETIYYINSKGGLKAIVISHPHYYTTHLVWAKTFDCPVYFCKDDEEWVSQSDDEGRRKLIEATSEDVVDGVKAIKVGGHFPGSLVLLWDKKLFIADSLVTTPSALYHVDRPRGTNSYVFMWSIPNMIPLPPTEIHKMWQALKMYDFESTHGAFVGLDVRDKNVKARVLESMKIQARAEGYSDLPILAENL
ncbi:putative metallo-beta-lactamase, ribonuclease Z/Hydroxyacylglutathione hydrolase [Septoria linicola]|nr:putative metallo-beta-lactamase, ribonuclease Z/Hydroxyacylglutathione hydrolase [Septoria linicola]